MFDHWYVPVAIMALNIVMWVQLEIQARRK